MNRFIFVIIFSILLITGFYIYLDHKNFSREDMQIFDSSFVPSNDEKLERINTSLVFSIGLYESTFPDIYCVCSSNNIMEICNENKTKLKQDNFVIRAGLREEYCEEWEVNIRTNEGLIYIGNYPNFTEIELFGSELEAKKKWKLILKSIY